ncbi:MAG TPA: ABC transporter permease subunit [Chitinophagaceae bacterium]|nr:ABC transporter permease subunit [Chitinophagaceae bacterium]
MWSVCKKELRQFFSSLTGYIAIAVFLLINGLVLFVFKNNILENGYATLDDFFRLAPWILLFLIPAITMRAFSDEYKGGTFEVLRTRPLSAGQLVQGKFWGAFLVAVLALLPTLVYYVTINQLAATSGIDSGAATGAYLGLFFLTAVFTSIGIYISSALSNSVVAFIVTALALALLYYGFTAISQLSVFQSGVDYFIELIGIESHYRSISRGVVDTRDLIYFGSLVLFFLLITQQTISKRV